MQEEELRRWVAEGLSLAEMGRRAGRHPSTIANWLHKYGLRAVYSERYAPKGQVPRAALISLVEAGATVREMSRALGRSESSVLRSLRDHGLCTARAKRRRENASVTDLPRYTFLTCRHHGRVEHVLEGRGYYRCKACRKQRVAEWRRRAKQRLLAEAGGRCTLCGYARYAGALHFHHLDPAKKSYGLSVRGITRSMAELRAEAKKCVLLCSNCHAEVEAGVATLKEGATFPM